MTVKLSWATIGSIIAALAGVAGTILTPIYGANLANSVATALQSISGLLVLIAGYHVTSVSASAAKAKIAASTLTSTSASTVFHIH